MGGDLCFGRDLFSTMVGSISLLYLYDLGVFQMS